MSEIWRHNALRVPGISYEADAIYQRLVDHDQYQLSTNSAEERHEHKQLKEAAYSESELSLTDINSSAAKTAPQQRADSIVSDDGMNDGPGPRSSEDVASQLPGMAAKTATTASINTLENAQQLTEQPVPSDTTSRPRKPPHLNPRVATFAPPPPSNLWDVCADHLNGVGSSHDKVHLSGCDDRSCRRKLHICRPFWDSARTGGLLGCGHGGENIQHKDHNGRAVVHWRPNCRMEYPRKKATAAGGRPCDNTAARPCHFGHDNPLARRSAASASQRRAPRNVFNWREPAASHAPNNRVAIPKQLSGPGSKPAAKHNGSTAPHGVEKKNGATPGSDGRVITQPTISRPNPVAASKTSRATSKTQDKDGGSSESARHLTQPEASSIGAPAKPAANLPHLRSARCANQPIVSGAVVSRAASTKQLNTPPPDLSPVPDSKGRWNEMGGFSSLPPELLHKVLPYLTRADLRNLAATNSYVANQVFGRITSIMCSAPKSANRVRKAQEYVSREMSFGYYQKQAYQCAILPDTAREIVQIVLYWAEAPLDLSAALHLAAPTPTHSKRLRNI
ncbi:hypothetical protein LTR22_005044 [Elasticomyces elasticus]|nr:hypothetical protein LTR22_005044 [Elasticomyces elasticus]KAK5767021.1 hypothetical protein LTS12_002786 [Elasticomyces elasticus]